MATFASTAVQKGNAAIARSHYEAYNSRGFSRTLQNMADNVEYHNLPSQVVHQGHQGVRDFFQGWVSAFPDSQVLIGNVLAGDTTTVVEGRFVGTHESLLTTPMGEIQPTGKRVDVPFCESMDIAQDKITRIRIYFDWLSVLGQLGQPCPS